MKDLPRLFLRGILFVQFSWAHFYSLITLIWRTIRPLSL